MMNRHGRTRTGRKIIFWILATVLTGWLILDPGGGSDAGIGPGSGLLGRLGPLLRGRSPIAAPDTSVEILLQEVASAVAGLETIMRELEDVPDHALTVAEEPGQPDLEAMLERTRAVREGREMLVALRLEVAEEGTQLARRAEALHWEERRPGEPDLDAAARTSAEAILNAVRTGRGTLRDTAGDISREVAELVLERAAHNWPGVAGRVNTIRAVQEVRIEELSTILRHYQELYRLLSPP